MFFSKPSVLTCFDLFSPSGWINLLVMISSIFLQTVVEMRESLVLAVWIDAKVADPETNDGLFMCLGDGW